MLIAPQPCVRNLPIPCNLDAGAIDRAMDLLGDSHEANSLTLFVGPENGNDAYELAEERGLALVVIIPGEILKSAWSWCLLASDGNSICANPLIGKTLI